MSKKHYVVWKGLTTGVFDNWPQAKAQIDGRTDAQFMGFPSLDEAQAAFKSTYTKALMQRSLAKNPNSKTVSSNVTAAKTTRKASNAFTKETIHPAPFAAEIAIFCDGACSPNPGKSGTGIAVYQHQVIKQLWYGCYLPNGTNNTAELTGLLEAFKLAQPYTSAGTQVKVFSDSKYSIDCITKWASGWKKKGWVRGKNEEIKNLELIKQCYALYNELKANLTISHVKAHANIEGNELADRMAVLARTSHESDFVLRSEPINIADVLAMASG